MVDFDVVEKDLELDGGVPRFLIASVDKDATKTLDEPNVNLFRDDLQ